jgi:hypothetical protein
MRRKNWSRNPDGCLAPRRTGGLTVGCNVTLTLSKFQSRLEVGQNTSTIALRVLRGHGEGTQCPGVHLGHPVPGGYKYGDLALQVGGVSRIGTIIYGLESRGTHT